MLVLLIYSRRTHLLSISCMQSTGLNAGYKDEINMVTDIGKLHSDLKRHLDSHSALLIHLFIRLISNGCVC